MQPTLYAVISDIHANYQALEAVERDAVRVRQQLKADSLHFIVLGDVVDYGPQPNECMEWITKHAEIIVQGNHDFDVGELSFNKPQTISPKLWPITIWTRAVTKREYRLRMYEWVRFLGGHYGKLSAAGLQDFMLFHGSVQRGYNGAIVTPREAWINIQQLKQNGLKYGLFGHTHMQGCFVEDVVDDPWGAQKNGNHQKALCYLVCPGNTRLENKTDPSWLPKLLSPAMEGHGVGCTPWSAMPDNPALLNPGAVGQPRLPWAAQGIAEFDNRAAYMLLKSNGRIEYQFRRVPYDVDQTIRLLREKVYWPPDGYQQLQGSDILREVEHPKPNPYPQDAWDALMVDFRNVVKTMESRLPEVVDTLVKQLRK